jgi:hypothetical protein
MCRMACVFMEILANGLEAGAILHQFADGTVPIWASREKMQEQRRERGVGESAKRAGHGGEGPLGQ